jgi:phosphate transport system substrate-binding protein
MSRGETRHVIKRHPLALAALVAMLSLAACGGGPTSSATTGPSGGGASGEIFVSGSSTVEPVSQAVSEAFRQLNPGFGFTVEGPGTGDGFAKFCAGETDVADASRAIRDSEIEACAAAGIEYVELLIGVDALTVMTHPDTPVDCLNLADLYALFGPESDDVATWQDAGTLAAELGSTTSYPADLALQITAPGEESGTYDAFLELADIGSQAVERGVIGEDDDPYLRLPGPNYTASPSDNVIVEGVEAGAGSLGFAGYAFYAEAAGAGASIKAVSIDAGEGCVAPSTETAADGSYALTRPLYIYVNTANADSNPALAAWVDFYLSDEGIANVSAVGYVALPETDLAATRAAWANR